MAKKRAPLEQAETTCRQIGHAIGSKLPKGWGFMLTLFSMRETDGFSTYMSNCKREDVIKALRELADSIEKREEV